MHVAIFDPTSEVLVDQSQMGAEHITESPVPLIIVKTNSGVGR